MMSASKLWKLGAISLSLLSSSLSYSKHNQIIDTSTWSMYQGNASHTGYIDATIDMSRIELIWQKKLGYALNPVVANQDNVFVTTDDTVYKLSSNNGDIIWSNKLPDLFEMSAAAIDKDNLYVQTMGLNHKGFIRSYELSTGELNYRHPFTGRWTSYYAPTVYNDNIYIPCGEKNGVCAYESETGKRLWSQELSIYEAWAPTVTEQYVITLTNVLSVFDRESGGLVFNYGKSDVYPIWGQDGAAIIGEMDDIIYAHYDGLGLLGFTKDVLRSVSLTSKQLIWENIKGYQGQPVVGGKIVYAALENGNVEAYSELTGELLWTWENESTSSIVGHLVLTNNVLLLSRLYDTVAIDLDSHKTVWSFPKEGQFTFSNGMIYLSSAEGEVYAFKVPVGKINPKIDVMKTSTIHGEIYSVGMGLNVIGSAITYHLSDGSMWRTGAGSSQVVRMKFVEVKEDTKGDLHYFFSSPEDGVIFSNIDSGKQYSTQGTLLSTGILEIIATPGKPTATMVGLAQIAENKPVNDDAFNYYNAKIGAIVPFKVIYEMDNGVWDKLTFAHGFSYHVNGEVHFKSNDVSSLVGLYKKYQSDFK